MKKILLFIIILATTCISAEAAYISGDMVTSDLWIRAVIHTEEKGPVEAIWQQGGEDITESGDRVIWGYFHASSEDVTWGSSQNPDVFVKIWFDHSDRLDVNFFHVSAPDIEVYSDYPYDGIADEQGTTTTSRRYIRHGYKNGESHMSENYEDGEPPPGYWVSGSPSGYFTGGDLRIGAVIHTEEKGAIEAVWYKGGKDTTLRGDRVIWGYFYANPNEVTWGSTDNPDLFVKIWFDVTGRVDVNFFHVSVPDIETYSDLFTKGFYDKSGTTILSNRYIRQVYRTDPPSECSAEDVNEFVYDAMTDTYLWYDKVPQADYTAYDSPEALLKHLRYNELDKWSYLTPTEEYYAYFISGKYIGPGFALEYDSNGYCRIKSVHRNSPAEAAGLKRTDKVIEINEKTIEEIEQDNLWGTILGQNLPGTKIRLKVEDTEGIVRELTLVQDWIAINAISDYDILNYNGLKIGYLVFDTFIEAAREELDSVFGYFKWNDIDELILDLRYNGGGEVSVARHLAGLIAGSRTDGEIFARYIHNDKYEYLNGAEYFEKPGKNALNMDRVFFITTGASCSATELVMNSLRPFIDVIPVGDTTCGKPVGMYGDDFCDMHINPVEFRVTNADDEGDYFEGIPPACYAEDDLTRLFGDMEEDSLKEALYYIANGSCLGDEEQQYSVRETGKQYNAAIRSYSSKREAGIFYDRNALLKKPKLFKKTQE
ncbi:S41 family peptidase [Desulfococcaceae bacterium HSG8]|nr:S41 family peptidase [Desulfococcaceae bacterium HSG8]